MKMPLFLSRYESGDIFFPFNGETYKIAEGNSIIYDSCGFPLKPDKHSMVYVSAWVFVGERLEKNKRIQQAKERAMSWMIYTMVILIVIINALVLASL